MGKTPAWTGGERRIIVTKTLVLSNGVELPGIGFGSYKSTDGRGAGAIAMALEAGYRMVDTAASYENEEEVGRAVRESGIPREEIFLTSKVWKTELGYEATRRSFLNSLERLGTDYLDLFLLHWPRPDPRTAGWEELDRESWRALEEFYRQGKVRAIGVSNFLPHHLIPLLETAQVPPMVDQLELHVGYLQEAAVSFCREHGICVQAWSPLGRRRCLELPLVGELAEKYGMTPAQLLLKFLAQQGFGLIPKASSPERLRQNLELPETDLSPEDMYRLRCLPQMGWSGEHPDLEWVPPQTC